MHLRPSGTKRAHATSSHGARQAQLKQIFITSFNSFKKALTYDAICAKVNTLALTLALALALAPRDQTRVCVV